MRRLNIAVALSLALGCDAQHELPSVACEATYARLEALECEANFKVLLVLGCFDAESDVPYEECNLAPLRRCSTEVAGEPVQPLDTFLDRRCGPEGTRTITWPEPDRAAIAAKKAAAVEAEAAALAEIEALAVAERDKARSLAIAAANAKLGRLEVLGPLSERAIAKVLTARIDDVRECYGLAVLSGTPVPARSRSTS